MIIKNAIIVALVLSISSAVVHGRVVFVQPGGSIQDAVDNASDGDTIVVRKGTYTATCIGSSDCKAVVHIKDKNHIKLKAAGRVIIDATGVEYGVLIGNGESRDDDIGPAPAPVGLNCDEVRLVQDASMEGPFQIESSARGIGVLNAQDVKIEGASVVGAELFAMNAACSEDLVIEGNRIEGALRTGILSFGDKNVLINRNIITGSAVAMIIDASDGVQVTANVLSGNTAGIVLASEQETVRRPLTLVSVSDVEINYNVIVDNDRPNLFGEGDFLAFIPKGCGIIVAAGIDVRASYNIISRNSSFGVVILGIPLYLFYEDPVIRPFVEDSTFSSNFIFGNGDDVDSMRWYSEGTDLLYRNSLFDFQTGALIVDPDDLGYTEETNCFEDNIIGSSIVHDGITDDGPGETLPECIRRRANLRA